MTQTATIFWAHVDADGAILSWGQCAGQDIFLQHLPEGLTAVARPEHVTGYDGWRYLNGEWVQPA
jgi:hypothetical protein